MREHLNSPLQKPGVQGCKGQKTQETEIEAEVGDERSVDDIAVSPTKLSKGRSSHAAQRSSRSGSIYLQTVDLGHARIRSRTLSAALLSANAKPKLEKKSRWG